MAQQAAVKRAADMQEIDCQAQDDAALTEQDDQFTLTVTRSNLSTYYIAFHSFIYVYFCIAFAHLHLLLNNILKYISCILWQRLLDLALFVVDRHSDREPLDEYINKKREMFLVQVTIYVNMFRIYIS